MSRSEAVAVLGFAPHSGWAAVVGLGGSRAEPEILVRSRVEIADPARPESKQPYHAVEALGRKEAAEQLDRYMKAAQANAYQAIQALMKDLEQAGWRTTSAGILDSSGRKGSSLDSILASHALIHTADGDHFRHALATVAERSGLTVSRIRVRGLESEAAARLARPLSSLQKAVHDLGRRVGPPWGADQKMAALLAWLLLPERGRRTVR